MSSDRGQGRRSQKPRHAGPKGDAGERRVHARANAVLKVEYDSRDNFLHDYSTNISRGGILFNTDRPPAVESSVELLLSFPGLLGHIALQGVVRWVSPHEDGIEVAVGVEFVRGDDAAWRALDALVERIMGGDEAVVAPAVIRVLVAANGTHLLDLIRSGLERFRREARRGEAFEFFSTASGTEALRVLRQDRYDLLITETVLTELDGESLIRAVREGPDPIDIPVIAVSVGGKEVRRRLLQLGADFCLLKPLRLPDVLQTMHELMSPEAG